MNITLGLPIIRTSVDHGTAFDKAATGMAQSTSLEAAIKIAAQISQKLKWTKEKNYPKKIWSKFS